MILCGGPLGFRVTSVDRISRQLPIYEAGVRAADAPQEQRWYKKHCEVSSTTTDQGVVFEAGRRNDLVQGPVGGRLATARGRPCPRSSHLSVATADLPTDALGMPSTNASRRDGTRGGWSGSHGHAGCVSVVSARTPAAERHRPRLAGECEEAGSRLGSCGQSCRARTGDARSGLASRCRLYVPYPVAKVEGDNLHAAGQTSEWAALPRCCVVAGAPETAAGRPSSRVVASTCAALLVLPASSILARRKTIVSKATPQWGCSWLAAAALRGVWVGRGAAWRDWCRHGWSFAAFDRCSCSDKVPSIYRPSRTLMAVGERQGHWVQWGWLRQDAGLRIRQRPHPRTVRVMFTSTTIVYLGRRGRMGKCAADSIDTATHCLTNRSPSLLPSLTTDPTSAAQDLQRPRRRPVAYESRRPLAAHDHSHLTHVPVLLHVR